MNGKRAFGDYQTPLEFAQKVCEYLRFERNITPEIVIEPTCGIGNFLESTLIFNAKAYYGIEINPVYCEYCEKRIQDERVHLIHSNFFEFDVKTLINDRTNVLVIGNPPWVTNSTLSSLDSANLPTKTNFKKLKGIDAITGSSNFDICEFMILKLVHEFHDTNTMITMLCKTSVARNVFQELKRNEVHFEYCDLLEFDAKRVFGVNTNACVLMIQLSQNRRTSDICHVYSIENTQTVQYTFGYINDQFYSNIQSDLFDFDGICCLEWRQGIKHDCSKVMELSHEQGAFYNGHNERVDIEKLLLFPLIKSSMFKYPIIHTSTKYVIVPQKKVREDTSYIETVAPKTWHYLNTHQESFYRRKSSIYRNAPPFSIFGIGEYSYAQYKVGVSGFYKKPLFSLIYSDDGKPMMTDDTSYFIGFERYEMAYIAMLLLNSEHVQKFLMSIAFLDAKRPYTKKVLSRLSFQKMFQTIDFGTLTKTEANLGLSKFSTEHMYMQFQNLPDFQK